MVARVCVLLYPLRPIDLPISITDKLWSKLNLFGFHMLSKVHSSYRRERNTSSIIYFLVMFGPLRGPVSTLPSSSPVILWLSLEPVWSRDSALSHD
jgi:hypothetical protein